MISSAGRDRPRAESAPATRTVATLVGTREPGSSDAAPSFYQPGGLTLAGESLYVADTNNHAIRVVDLGTKATRTLALEGVSPPTPPARKPTFANAAEIAVPAAKVAPGDEIITEVDGGEAAKPPQGGNRGGGMRMRF